MFIIIGIVVLLFIAYFLIKKQGKKETQKAKIHAKNQVTKSTGKKKKITLENIAVLNPERQNLLAQEIEKSGLLSGAVLSKIFSEAHCFVAVQEGNPLGVIAWKDKNATTAQLMLHWVNTSGRKQKTGLRLLLKFLRTARKTKNEAIFLTQDTAEKTDFYIHFGFSKVVVSKPEFKSNNLDTAGLPVKLRLNLNTWEDKQTYF